MYFKYFFKPYKQLNLKESKKNFSEFFFCKISHFTHIQIILVVFKLTTFILKKKIGVFLKVSVKILKSFSKINFQIVIKKQQQSLTSIMYYNYLLTHCQSAAASLPKLLIQVSFGLLIRKNNLYECAFYLVVFYLLIQYVFFCFCIVQLLICLFFFSDYI